MVLSLFTSPASKNEREKKRKDCSKGLIDLNNNINVKYRQNTGR